MYIYIYTYRERERERARESESESEREGGTYIGRAVRTLWSGSKLQWRQAVGRSGGKVEASRRKALTTACLHLNSFQ